MLLANFELVMSIQDNLCFSCILLFGKLKYGIWQISRL